MKIEELNKLLAKPSILKSRIGFYEKKKIIDVRLDILKDLEKHKP